MMAVPNIYVWVVFDDFCMIMVVGHLSLEGSGSHGNGARRLVGNDFHRDTDGLLHRLSRCCLAALPSAPVCVSADVCIFVVFIVCAQPIGLSGATGAPLLAWLVDFDLYPSCHGLCGTVLVFVSTRLLLGEQTKRLPPGLIFVRFV
jgi:hypothetical protein